MTYQLALSAAFALCAVAFYLLSRLLTENRKLVAARRKTASAIIRLRRQLAAYAACLEQAGDEYQELHEQHEELRSERDEFAREAEVRRAVRERVWS
jgi:hypothetical protein